MKTQITPAPKQLTIISTIRFRTLNVSVKEQELTTSGAICTLLITKD